MPRNDPRLTFSSLTANEILLDRAIRHALYLERLKTGEARWLLGYLEDEVFPDLVAKLDARLSRIAARGFDSGVWTTLRYQNMVKELREIIRVGTSGAAVQFAARLRAIARAEGVWQASVFGSAVPFGLDFNLPSAETLSAIVSSQPFRGATLGTWFRGLGRSTADRVERAISLGLAEGETVGQMVQRLRGTRASGYTNGILQTTRRDAEAIVRTAVNHTTTHARDAMYLENDDLVKGVRWVSTLDGRTTPVCQERDGKVYPVGDGPRPPAHFACRSTTAPVLRSWKELGLDLDEAPEGTRASMDGQVPASLTYGEWLKRQPFDVQKEALGATRARLFRDGSLPIDRFVDRSGRSFTLEELARREGLTL
ncbi:MAG: minor capsid protein [Rhodospirillaceae bacterium]